VEPGDEINNALLKYRSFQTGFLDVSHREDYFRAENHPSECLPEEFASRVGEFRQMPIFEGVEALIGVFGLGSLSADLPYIQAFQDLVLELQRRENMSIVNFLQYWDQHASLRGVQVSEDSDAIRILTIHRAKGLEFKGVIVPFCDWEVTTDHRKANMLWCETKGTPFSRIPTLPLRYTSKMKQTLFSSFYYRERMQGYLDSLNLLYVAFTRATDVLFAGIPDRKDGAWGRVGDLLSAIESRDAQISPSLGSLGKFREGRQLVIGEMPEFEDRSSGEEAWMFRSYVSRRGEDLPKLRLRSQEEWTAEEGISRSGRGFGNMMHLAFSRIRTARDVDAVVAGLKREGILEEAEAPGLLEEIRKMIRRPGVRDWFHPLPGDSLFTERALISGDGHLLRPDRVMVREGRCTVVDFKFGLQEKAADERQMVRYLSLLSKIYALPPQGFLWYAMLDRIKKVML
jgi:ATP-dependent helicase/nuclease subunit A